MKEFAFCISDNSLMATLTKNWTIWIPKIIKKAELESSSRSKLFESCRTLINQMSHKSPEEIAEGKWHTVCTV